MEAAIGRRPGRPARLSRESVLRAAVEVADEGGIEALTMQRIGEAVGAEAMSLYRHVRNKEDLIDGAVDLVFAEIELPPTDTDWRTAMRRRAVSVREVLRRHPWAVGLMESRAMPGPANMRHHDAVLGLLLGAGFTSATATHAYNLVDSFVYGFALQERGMPFGNPDELAARSEEHTSELLSHLNLVCRLLLEKKKIKQGKVLHAYLFVGTRGTGKTPMAKILASFFF